MSRMQIILIYLVVCSALFGAFKVFHVTERFPSLVRPRLFQSEDTAFQPIKISSKEEFELSLASKTQLLKVRTEMFRGLTKGMTNLKDRSDENEIRQMGKDVNDNFANRLRALVNNCYIGSRAKQLYALEEKRGNKSAGEELLKKFAELQEEIRSEIEIAKSLQIDTWGYENDLKEYNEAFVFMYLTMSCISKPDAK